jgi:hypothetical protein
MEDIKENRIKIAQKYKDISDLCDDIIKFSIIIGSEINLNIENPQEKVSACLYLRIIDGVQAAISLIMQGFSYDAWVVIRSILEAFFIFKKCCLDKEFTLRYLQSDDLEYKKLVNVALGIPEGDLPQREDYSPEEMREQFNKINSNLKKAIEQHQVKKLIKDQIATDVGLSDFYNFCYRPASGYTHASPRTLEKYLKIDELNNVWRLVLEPDDNAAKAHLIGLSGLLLVSIRSICILFGLQRDDSIHDFEKRIFEIS